MAQDGRDAGADVVEKVTHSVRSCSGCVPACGELENAKWRLHVLGWSPWAGQCGEYSYWHPPLQIFPLGMHRGAQLQSVSPQIVPAESLGLHLILPSSAQASPGGSILPWAPCPALRAPSSPSLSSLGGRTGTGTSSVKGMHCWDCGVWDAWKHQAENWEATPTSLSPTPLLFSQGSEIHSGVAAEHL